MYKRQITACAILEEADGTTRIEQRQFGAFKRDRGALAAWAASLAPDEVVMESTGIYWKSPYAALEAVGIRGQVVNARHVKNVPGRNTCLLYTSVEHVEGFGFDAKQVDCLGRG